MAWFRLRDAQEFNRYAEVCEPDLALYDTVEN
jgi:hypothetical protein